MPRALTAAMLVLCISASAGSACVQGRQLTDQEAKQIAEQITAKFVTAWNRGDAEAVSKLFSEHPSYLPALGPVWDSQEAIKNGISPRINMKIAEKLLEAHAAGDNVWATGEWTLTPASGSPIAGRYAWIAVPEGGDWRFRLQISNVAPPPK